MAKKPVSAQTKKKNELKTALIFFVVLIAVVAAGFAVAQYYGNKIGAAATENSEMRHAHATVTYLDDSIVVTQIEEVEEGETDIQPGDSVIAPASAVTEENAPNLTFGDEVTVYYDGNIVVSSNGEKQFGHVLALVSEKAAATAESGESDVGDSVTVDATGESNTFQIVASDAGDGLSYEITQVDETTTAEDVAASQEALASDTATITIAEQEPEESADNPADENAA
jgi:flagellar basal body-associated protein FliL